MFEKFTDRTRRVVVLAGEEARRFNHNYIGTEHILLGMLSEGEAVAAKALMALGLTSDQVRKEVENVVGQGQQAPSGHIPFTPRAKKVLDLSLPEALHMGHNYIGTEHLLLGLIREGEGVATQILVSCGLELTAVRQKVIQLLGSYTAPTTITNKTITGVDVVQVAGGGTGQVTRAAGLDKQILELQAPREPRWIDLTGLDGQKVAINLDVVPALVQAQDHTVVHVGGASLWVKESIAEIWGDD